MSEEKSGFIVKFYDKAYEDKSILELLDMVLVYGFYFTF